MAVGVGFGDGVGVAADPDNRCSGDKFSVRRDRAALQGGSEERDRAKLVIGEETGRIGREAIRLDREIDDLLVLRRLEIERPFRVRRLRRQRGAGRIL